MFRKTLLAALAVSTIASAPSFAQALSSQANVIQRGDNNGAFVVQGDPAGLINNTGFARVRQRGDDNEARIDQVNFNGQSTNNAFANRAITEQDAVNGFIRIDQIHDYGIVGNNRAFVDQTQDDAQARVFTRGDRNLVDIDQTAPGVNGRVRVEQNGNRNTVDVDQSSINGEIFVVQGDFNDTPGGAPDASDNVATIASQGVDPFIRVNQFGNVNQTTVFEDGISGQIRVFQNGDVNGADIIQTGTSNVIRVEVFPGGDGNDVRIDQSGDDSRVRTFQSADFGTIEVDQRDTLGLGGDNDVLVTQEVGADDSDVDVLQDGSDLAAIITQTTPNGLAMVTQFGLSNLATVTQ